ncbi:MAG TPA: protein kinase [Bryobacteraceae bacterium]
MERERWQRLEQVCQAALDRSAGERLAFLEKACAGDQALYQEVEALLAHEKQAEKYLEGPLLGLIPEVVESDGREPTSASREDAALIGQAVSHYRILEKLGSGGMGVVYKTQDTKLGRDVALKILPGAVAHDAERMARFEREARTLASLNHPNIAAIYGLEDSNGTRALVMELVEGPTLAELLESRNSKLGTGKAAPITAPSFNSRSSSFDPLPIAKQIAEALEYAHEHGIIHRDLKPANVKIAREGTVKVLDFGLAKVLDPHGWQAAPNPTHPPALDASATETGMILGTAAYMSPEQAKGQLVDRRCDIWAYGCVLFEMISGRKAFAGETISDVLAAVIKSEPDWSALPKTTSLPIERLIRRCLRKDVRQRLQAIGDARIAIEEMIAGGAGAGPVLALAESFPVRRERPSPRRALAWALVGLLVGALIGSVAIWKFAVPPPQPSMHFSAVTNFAGVQAQPALSPDGRSVAFVSDRDGPYEIYVGLISGGNLVKLTDDPKFKARPCWSPDGSQIAYARLNHSGIWDIWEVPALGGTPRRLILNALDPAWSPDGQTLAYANSVTGALWTSDLTGQNAKQVAAPDAGSRFAEPRFSPNGRELAFVKRWPGPYGFLEVTELASGKVRQLTTDEALALSPAWSPDGKFIYFAWSRGGTVNVWKIAAIGSEPVQITAGQGDDAQLDVSAEGKRIVFSTFRANTRISQLDLERKPGLQVLKPLTADPARSQLAPAYSPHGKHLAYFSNVKGIELEGIWLANANGSDPVSLVQDRRISNVFPHWTSDGKWLIYLAYLQSGGEYRRIPVSGGVPQILVENRNTQAFLFDAGPGGRLLYEGSNHEAVAFDPQSRQTQNLGALPAGEKCSVLRFSPDGHLVAYTVNAGEQDDPKAGLWVTDFKNPSRQVFHGWVVWYARGPNREIYLLEGKPDLNGVLWKVGWDGKDLTRLSWTVPLVHSYYVQPGQNDTNFFDVSPDGRHLAVTVESVLQANIGMIENIP